MEYSLSTLVTCGVKTWLPRCSFLDNSTTHNTCFLNGVVHKTTFGEKGDGITVKHEKKAN